MSSKDVVVETCVIRTFAWSRGVCTDFMACFRASMHRAGKSVGGEISDSSSIVCSYVEHRDRCGSVEMARLYSASRVEDSLGRREGGGRHGRTRDAASQPPDKDGETGALQVSEPPHDNELEPLELLFGAKCVSEAERRGQDEVAAPICGET